MAGRIKAEDIATVKERTSIEDVVRDHVTLRPAGVGSLKGLCPFHDEKSPSFTVRPTVGSYHCFGCGEGGDVISFVQKVEHLTFTESIERLAAKLGLELHYEEGGGPREGGVSLGKRSRLIEAHRVAQEFYASLLLDTGRPEARAGRDFLRERGFDGAAAETFGIGFAPQGGEALSRHLRERGFTEDEMVTGGLSGRGSRGLYDRFRGRLVWPIRDTTGDTVGFGARRLFDDDRIAAKYLNTSETPIYKKSQVLYGLDAAKKAISTERRAIVVEGYTDVMAAHLSGVEGAVATCGTAFGIEHIKILRRIMRDETDGPQARVIFTFDGDAAGQKAAMKAFGEDQRWAAQSFVAVAPDGMDPCELRIAKGDAAVRALVDDAVPMFEFAVRTTIRRFDLDTAEGRVRGDEGRRADHRLDPRHQPAAGVHPHRLRVARHRGRADGRRGQEGRPGAPRRRGRHLAAAGRHRRGARARPRRGSVPAGARPARPGGVHRAAAAPGAHPVPAASSPTPRSTRCVPRSSWHPRTGPCSTASGSRRRPRDGRRPRPGWPPSARPHRSPCAAWSPSSRWRRCRPASTASSGLPPQRYLDSLVVGVRDAQLGRLIADAMASVRRVQNDPDSDPTDLRERTMALHRLELERVALRERLSS